MKACPRCGITRKKLSKKCIRCTLETCGGRHCGVTIKGDIGKRVTLIRAFWVCQICISNGIAMALRRIAKGSSKKR